MERIKNLPEISVIACFYNNEQYAASCINSLLNQSYTSFELILVDDGSTDCTHDVLSSYSSNRLVTIVSKKNGGVSDARNVGVEHASGRYVTFVDGDDVVSPFFLEALHSAIEGFDGMVIGGLEPIALNEIDTFLSNISRSNTWHYLSQKEIITKILYKVISTSACGNLARLDLYKAVPFEKGIRYDEALIVPVILAENHFRVLTHAYYGYVMHSDSMIRSDANNETVCEYYDAIKFGKKAFLDKYPDLVRASNYWSALYGSRVQAMVDTIANPSCNTIVISEELLNTVKKSIWDIMSDSNIAPINKLRIFLYVFAPRLHGVLLRLHNARKKKIH